MKASNISFSFLIVFLIFTNAMLAQWVQTNLNSGIGRSLYSDGTTLYAASNQGVYYTTDNGNNWISIGPVNEDINALVKAGNKIIAASSGGHGIFLSTNNGQSWYQPPTLSNKAVYALEKDSSYIFAATWGNGIYRSPDNGESWESAGLNGKAFKDLLVVGDKLFAFSSDSNSKIYYSGDNGSTWNYGSLGYPASNPNRLFYNDGKLFACDMGLWASTDMGGTWHIQYGLTFDSTGYPIDIMLFAAITKNNQFLIASVMFESIYISSDNGVSWTPFNEGIITDWTFIDLTVHGLNIWGIRDLFGNAYKRPVSDLISDVNDEVNVINDFSLSQNYPNPFNPATTINYSLAKEGHIRLTVYNAIGSKVATLADEYKPAGNYSIQFNGNSLSSGIYLYRLETPIYSAAKKFILMK